MAPSVAEEEYSLVGPSSHASQLVGSKSGSGVLFVITGGMAFNFFVKAVAL